MAAVVRVWAATAMDGNSVRHPSGRGDPPEWREVWDQRAETIADSAELVVGEGIDRVPSWVASRRLRETLEFIGDTHGLRMLDIGCGDGRILGRLPAERWGVDFSANMLRLARRRIGTDIPLAQASAIALPFQDDSFDLTLCLNVLHYLADDDARTALTEMLRVTRPGGRLVMHVKSSVSPVGVSKRLASVGRGLLNQPRAIREYYRRPRWYRVALQPGARQVGRFSYGLQPTGAAPVGMLRRYAGLEERLRSQLPSHGFGVDCYLKFAIEPARS